MRIAHGMFLWQEPREVLEPCLRSTVPHVDEVIIAEGLIEGVPDLGLGPHTDLGWLAEPSDFLPDHIHIASRGSDRDQGVDPWKSISQACTWILRKAQQLDCDWLLFVDADQELHDADYLRQWLDGYSYSFPLRRVEPDGREMCCPWQLIHAPSFERYIAGCYVLERKAPEMVVNLVPPGPRHPSRGPWISHHPDRRPPWRRAHRLGELETVLEPPPPAGVLAPDHIGLYTPAS